MITSLNNLRDRVAQILKPLRYDRVSFSGIYFNRHHGENGTWYVEFICTDKAADSLSYEVRDACGQGILTFWVEERPDNGWAIVPAARLMGRHERELRIIHSMTGGLSEAQFTSAAALDFVDSLRVKRDEVARLLSNQ